MKTIALIGMLVMLCCVRAQAQSFSGQSSGDIFVVPPYRVCLGTDDGNSVCLKQSANGEASFTGKLIGGILGGSDISIPLTSGHTSSALVTVPGPFNSIAHAEVQIFNALGNAPDAGAGYPLGNDFQILDRGPSDFDLEHTKVYTTTAASLSIGANTNVPVGAVLEGNGIVGPLTGTTTWLATASGQQLAIGTYTANTESLTYSSTANCPTAGTWGIVDATHLCLNTAKTHSGTTDIEQVGNTLIEQRGIWLRCNAVQPLQYAGDDWCRVLDENGNSVMRLPSNVSASAPQNAIQFDVPIQIGGGGVLTEILTGNATLTFGAISAQTCSEQNISISGATAGSAAFASPALTLGNTNLSWSAWVSSTNVLTVRVCNPSSGSITPAAVAWKAQVSQ